MSTAGWFVLRRKEAIPRAPGQLAWALWKTSDLHVPRQGGPQYMTHSAASIKSEIHLLHWQAVAGSRGRRTGPNRRGALRTAKAVGKGLIVGRTAYDFVTVLLAGRVHLLWAAAGSGPAPTDEVRCTLPKLSSKVSL